MSDDAGRNAWLANMAALGAGGGSAGDLFKLAHTNFFGLMRQDKLWRT